jgi:hypothetical protein
MKRLLLVALVAAAMPVSAAPIHFNGMTCDYSSISIQSNGEMNVVCQGNTPTPSPTPTPTPSPTPSPTPTPPSGSYPMLKIGGTNNIMEGTDGVVLVFELPKTWPDTAHSPVTSAQAQFSSRPSRNWGVETYEAKYSPIPGDFSNLQLPCGKSDKFTNYQLRWGTVAGCIVDTRTWYLNWRVVGCPIGYICGNDVFVSH